MNVSQGAFLHRHRLDSMTLKCLFLLSLLLTYFFKFFVFLAKHMLLLHSPFSWGVDNQGCEFWHWGSLGSSSINPQLPLEHPVGLSLITCPAVVIKQWPRTKPLCWASWDPGLSQSIPQSQGWGYSVPKPLPPHRDLAAVVSDLNREAVTSWAHSSQKWECRFDLYREYKA